MPPWVRNKPEHKIKDCEDRHIDLIDLALGELIPYSEERLPDDYVFPTQAGGVIKNFGNYVAKLFAFVGVDGSANILRHTFASMFLTGGGALAELKEYMGHSSIQITEKHYAAFIPGKNKTIHSIDFGIESTPIVAPAWPGEKKKGPKLLVYNNKDTVAL